jgi:predicted amidophosphoribosyltransferase
MAQKYNNIYVGKNGEYFYLKSYMPKNRKAECASYAACDPHIRKHSEYILKYKKGDPQAIAFFVKILINIIYDYFYFYDLILPVPPSNSYLDSYPNSIVCAHVSALGNIRTIERAIVCYKGHKPGHTENIGSKIKDSAHISVSEKYNFESKNIIIFDDIITTGTTFSRIKNLFLKKGANLVTGIFLGKTHSPREFINEAVNG